MPLRALAPGQVEDHLLELITWLCCPALMGAPIDLSGSARVEHFGRGFDILGLFEVLHLDFSTFIIKLQSVQTVLLCSSSDLRRKLVNRK